MFAMILIVLFNNYYYLNKRETVQIGVFKGKEVVPTGNHVRIKYTFTPLNIIIIMHSCPDIGFIRSESF